MKNKYTVLSTEYSGFTLIELIVYIGLFAIFITGAVIFAWNAIFVSEKSAVQDAVNQNMRLAIQKISSSIKNSSGINLVSSSTISLSNSDASRNPTIFDVSNGRLRMGFGTSGSCPATSPCFLTDNTVNVSSLTFENLSSGQSKNIRFTLTIQTDGQKSEWQKISTYSESVEIRSR